MFVKYSFIYDSFYVIYLFLLFKIIKNIFLNYYKRAVFAKIKKKERKEETS